MAATAAIAHPEAELVAPELHEHALTAAELRLGRRLTDGERRIDVVGVDRVLVVGKQQLVDALEREQLQAGRRFARAALAGREPRMRLRLTPQIRSAVRSLYAAGVLAARGEIRRAGYDPDNLPRRLAHAAVRTRLAVIERNLGTRLDEHGYNLEHRLAISTDLSTATHGAIVDAVRKLPGFRAIGADFTTVPFDAGMGSVWDQADSAGVTTSWTYTAIMDASVCDPCAELDGSSYPSWEAIQDVLPDGGPNPDCDGGDRCRCRAVPEFGGSSGSGGGEPSPTIGDETLLEPQPAADQITGRIPGVGAPPAIEAPPVSPAPHLELPARAPLLSTREAATVYRDTAFQPVNAVLRGDTTRYTLDTVVTEDGLTVRDLRDALDAGMKPLEADARRYRGISNVGEVFGVKSPGDLVGRTITDPAFASTTRSLTDAQRFAGDNGVVLRILAPAGTDAIDLGNGELLLQRDLQFKVQSYDAEKNVLDVYVHKGFVDTVSVGPGPPIPRELVERIQSMGLDRPIGDWTPTSEIGREVFATANDTEHLYSTDGVYTAERATLHDRIDGSFFDGKAPTAEGEQRHYFFTAGGGASGKSSLTFELEGREVTVDELRDRPDWVVIDPYAIKAMLPEYQQLREAGDLYAASGVHEESSMLAKRIADEAAAKGYNVVLDTTGSGSSFLAKLEAAHADGYETQVSMITVRTNTAIVRSFARADNPESKSFGRYVATDPLKGAHAGASAQLALWSDAPYVDRWTLIDNEGVEPRTIASSDSGVVDREAWDATLAKADERGIEIKPRVPSVGPSKVVEIGVTPFRAGEDNALGFYKSKKWERFVRDAQDSARPYGVTLDGFDRVTGVWEGETEPSVVVRAHDGEAGLRAYASNLGHAYNQDGVLLFRPESMLAPGYAPVSPRFMATFAEARGEKEVLAAMQEVGIPGGRFLADGRLQIISDGEASFVTKVDALAERLGISYQATLGEMQLVAHDEYAWLLGAYKPGEALEPIAPAAASATAAEPFYPGTSTGLMDAVTKELDERATRWAEDRGIPKDELVQQMNDRIRELTENADLRMRIEPGNFVKALEDGRFKSQFETGTSGGAFDNALRAQAENELFGYPEDLAPEERPIYGYLGGAGEAGWVDMYGDVMVRFNPELRARSTYSLDDSLGLQIAPQPIVGGEGSLTYPWIMEPPAEIAEARFDEFVGAYPELQIHGGVTLRDVAEVVLPRWRESFYWRQDVERGDRIEAILQTELDKAIKAGQDTTGFEESLVAVRADRARAEGFLADPFVAIEERLRELGIKVRRVETFEELVEP